MKRATTRFRASDIVLGIKTVCMARFSLFIMSSMVEMHKGVPPLLTDSCYASSYYTTAIHIYPHLPPGVIPASFALIVSLFLPSSSGRVARQSCTIFPPFSLQLNPRFQQSLEQ